MADEAAVLEVAVEGKSTNIDSFLAKIEGQLDRTADAADKAGDEIGKGIGQGSERAKESLGELDAAAVKAARESLQLASAMARLDAAQNNAGGGADRLRTALESTVGVSARQDVAIRTQIAQLERLGKAQEAAANRAQARAKAEAEAAARPRTPGGGGFGAEFGQSFKEGLVGFAAPAVAAGAAIEAVKGTVESFKEAFNFKAELDSTTASIRLQLQGIRDSNQVFAEANAFGQKYKLTQEETTGAIQASIGVLRTSKASVEDTLGVLSRLTVLAPGKSIEDAAFSVRELASGDITSLAEQFNISRGKAYEMRDAITSGKDVVQVLSQFLDQAGVSMDTLAAKTQGASGKMKDVAIAQEQLKLAQAEFAQGPGLAALDIQAKATTGLTRLLGGGGGLQGAYQSLLQSMAAGNPAAMALAQSFGIQGSAVQAAAQQMLQHAQASQQAAAAQAAISPAQQAYSDTVAVLVGQLQAGAITQEQYGAAVQQAAAGLQQAATTTQQGATAYSAYEQAARAAATSTADLTTGVSEADAKAQIAKVSTDAHAAALAQLDATAQSAAAAVIAGGGNIAATAARLAASSSQVDQLTAAYIRLQAAQQAAGIAGAARIATQKNNTLDYTGGRGVGVDAPGLRGSGDVDKALQNIKDIDKEEKDLAAARVEYRRTELEGQKNKNALIAFEKEQLEGLNKDTPEYVRQQQRILQLQQQQAKAGGGGGRGSGKGKLSAADKEQKALLKGQEDYQNKSLDSAREFEEAQGKIAEDAAKKRAEAEQKYNQDSLDSRADFYLGLADVEDEGQRNAMAAKYEAIVQDTQKIAQTQGADAADAYQQAAEQSLQKQSQIQAKIDAAKKKASESKGGEKKAAQSQVEYLTGVLALQQKSDDNRLNQIRNAGSAIASEEERQYAEAELRYAEHLNKLGIAYERKFGAKPGQGTTATLPDASPASGPVSAPASVAASTPGGSTSTQPAAGDQVTRVVDENAQAAIDGLGARLEGKLQGATDAIASLAPRISAVEQAVKGIKRGSVVGSGG